MKESLTELLSSVLDFIVTIIGFMLIGLVVSPTYNSIAWEFNLPPLNYWTICGAMYTLHKIFFGVKLKKD